jgi:hypothetical protein
MYQTGVGNKQALSTRQPFEDEDDYESLRSLITPPFPY